MDLSAIYYVGGSVIVATVNSDPGTYSSHQSSSYTQKQTCEPEHMPITTDQRNGGVATIYDLGGTQWRSSRSVAATNMEMSHAYEWEEYAHQRNRGVATNGETRAHQCNRGVATNGETRATNGETLAMNGRHACIIQHSGEVATNGEIRAHQLSGGVERKKTRPASRGRVNTTTTRPRLRRPGHFQHIGCPDRQLVGQSQHLKEVRGSRGRDKTRRN